MLPRCARFEHHQNMTARQLILRSVFPLTIISFAAFTKWWYVSPVDAPDTMMSGFPLAFLSDGWHTSMSFQIFLIEFAIDLLVYFLFWLLVMKLFDRYVRNFIISKVLTFSLYILATTIFVMTIFVASFPEHVFKIKRDWHMEIIKTGCKMTWQVQERPGIDNDNPRTG